MRGSRIWSWESTQWTDNATGLQSKGMGMKVVGALTYPETMFSELRNMSS